MAKQYIYSAINPIWMNPVKTFNPIYNNLPFDFQPNQKPYTQKAKKGLPQTLQVLSDWMPILKIYDGEKGFLVDTITGATPTTGIIGQTFTLYEFTIVWASYTEGYYYIEISYTDDSAVLQINRSGLIEMRSNFTQTVVLQYTNSTNQFAAVFSTGIIFTLVVEGNIEDYTPAFEDVIYDDQYHNTTKLNSIPRREFNFYAGRNRSSPGIPPWMVDKINWAFSCDQLLIEGIYYQNTTGSKWEVMRADQTSPNFVGLKIPIIEVINRYLQSYNPGLIPAGAVQVITRTKTYSGVTADFNIPGIFKDFSLLTRIVIYNNGANILTINAGTAANGSAPITAPFVTNGQLKEIWNIDELFNGVSTLYLSGLTGANVNIVVEYDQLDAPYVTPPIASKPFVKGNRGSYEEVTIGDFANDWNVSTGVGIGLWAQCVIAGTNGTKDMNGLTEIGWNPSMPLTRDMLVGNINNTVSLNAGNLPSFNISIGQDLKGGNGGGTVKVLSSQNPGPNGNGNINIPYTGTANPIDISNRARVTLRYVCITN
jgi:hypothetical protein